MTSRNRQRPIFGPSLNPLSRLKAAMREAIASGNYSRAQIVDRMNEAAKMEGLGNGRGARLTAAALDGWLAETKGNMIPVGLLPCFCWAVESLEPLRVLAGCLGAEVIGEGDAKLLALAKLEKEERRLAKAKRRLRLEMDDE